MAKNQEEYQFIRKRAKDIKMITLAVDSSSKEIGIGIFNGPELIAERYIIAEAHYNSILLPLINETLQKVKIQIKDIEIFASTLGPGSFTGIRVGIATMKALAKGLGKFFYGTTVLNILANSVKNDVNLLYPILDAKRGEIYTAEYKLESNVIEQKTDTRLLKWSDFVKEINEGQSLCYLKYENIEVDLLKKDSKILLIELEHIDLGIFNEIIMREMEFVRKKDNFFLSPTYIREPEAIINLKKGKIHA